MSSLAAEIVRVARSQVGRKDWMYSATRDEFGPGTNKCNKFVYDVLVEVHVTPPPKVTIYVFFGRPPLAGEWADPKVAIDGWEVVATPLPGDVIAEKHLYSDATGHVGIVVGSGLTVSASSYVGGVIVENDWGFRAGDVPVFRRYSR